MYIICWYKYNSKKNEYEFNHIENFKNGVSNFPTILFKEQNSWKSFKWKKTFARLENKKVIEIEL